MNVSVEDSSTFFAREERSSTGKSQTFVVTGSCILYHCLVKHKQNNDCAQHNKFGMSFVGQVVWDTEPVFFFLWAFCFFSARPRRFGEKKVTRNIEKKAHGLMKKRLERCVFRLDVLWQHVLRCPILLYRRVSQL